MEQDKRMFYTMTNVDETWNLLLSYLEQRIFQQPSHIFLKFSFISSFNKWYKILFSKINNHLKTKYWMHYVKKDWQMSSSIILISLDSLQVILPILKGLLIYMKTGIKVQSILLLETPKRKVYFLKIKYIFNVKTIIIAHRISTA